MRLVRALGIGLATLVVGSAGCSLDFPKVSRPHTFRCQGDRDCANGYVCGADGYCVSKSSVGPGHGGNGDGGIADGGTGDGGVVDGGTDGGADGGSGDGGSGDGGSDGGGIGPGGCLASIAVWPSVFDDAFDTPATVYLPATSSATAATLAGNGKNLTVTLTGNGGEYAMSFPKDLPVGSYVLKVPSGTSPGVCYSTNLQVVSEISSVTANVTSDPMAVSAIASTRVHLSITGLTLHPSANPVPVWAYAVASGVKPVVLDHPCLEGPTEVDATAPSSSSAAGSYDVVVVTPVGAVRGAAAISFIDGLLPPKITSVSPVHVQVGPATTKVTVTGSNVGSGDEIALSCIGPTGSFVTGTYQALTTDGSGDLQADVAPHAGVVAGAPCKLAYKGSSVPSLATEFPGLSTYDPAAAPVTSQWTRAGGLLQGRTGAGAAIVRLTSGQRYLVVAGGVDHSGATTIPAVEDEIFPIHADGTFVQLTQHDPGLLHASGIVFPTLIAAGHIVYALGGNPPSGAPSSGVYEAELLDPADRPAGLKANLVVGKNVTGPGSSPVYYYTITPTFAAKPSNPVAEGPAAFIIQVPMPENDPAEVDLSWDPVAHATGYDVYRGTVPASDDLQRVNPTLVKSSTYDDTGPGSNTGIPPPEPGNLSDWYPVTSPALSGAFTRAGGVSVPVGPSAGDRDLVIGGGQKSGDLDSTVVGSLTPATTGRGFDLSTFTATTMVLSSPRSEVEARVVGPDWISSGVTEPWVLFGPGDDATGAPVDAWRAKAPATVISSGSGTTPADPGAAFCVGATSALLAGATSTGQPVVLLAPLTVDAAFTPPVPKVGPWQDVSTTPGAGPQTPVVDMATAEDGGYCYVVGGTDASTGDSIGDIELTIR